MKPSQPLHTKLLYGEGIHVILSKRLLKVIDQPKTLRLHPEFYHTQLLPGSLSNLTFTAWHHIVCFSHSVSPLIERDACAIDLINFSYIVLQFAYASAICCTGNGSHFCRNIYFIVTVFCNDEEKTAKGQELNAQNKTMSTK